MEVMGVRLQACDVIAALPAGKWPYGSYCQDLCGQDRETALWENDGRPAGPTSGSASVAQHPTEQLQLSPIMYGRRTRTNLLMTNEWLRSPHDETAHDALREAKDKQSKASCNKTGECRGLYKHIIRTDDEPMQPSSTSSSATTTKTFNTAQQQQRRQPRIVTRSGRSGKPQPDS